jgi:hypothetical protein
MTERAEIFKDRMFALVRELADKSYQILAWAEGKIPKGGHSISFNEAAIELFDDSLLTDSLNRGAIIYDKRVTRALRELSDAVAPLDDYGRDTMEVINDPLMEVVRQKASEVLRLIEISDKSENTVTFIEEGTLRVLEP